jgi:hypothetical protein
MRTIPEIVANLKTLLEELEQHTGLPSENTYGISDDTITFNFDNMNVTGGASDFSISQYENMGGDVTLDLSYPGATTTLKI